VAPAIKNKGIMVQEPMVRIMILLVRSAQLLFVSVVFVQQVEFYQHYARKESRSYRQRTADVNQQVPRTEFTY
jgi:hypothetical protein